MLFRFLFPSKKQTAKDKFDVEHDPSLDRALFHQDHRSVMIYLILNRGLNFIDIEGNSCLHTAAMRNSPFCIVLIARGLSVLQTNLRLETPLHLASTAKEPVNLRFTVNDQQAIARYPFKDHLLEQIYLDVCNEKIPVHFVLKCLLSQPDINVNAQTNELATPLNLAVRANAPLEVLSLLLQKGANPYLKDSSRKSCFDWAVSNSDETTLNYLEKVSMLLILMSAKCIPRIGKHESSFLRILPKELIRELSVFF